MVDEGTLDIRHLAAMVETHDCGCYFVEEDLNRPKYLETSACGQIIRGFSLLFGSEYPRNLGLQLSGGLVTGGLHG